MQEQISTDTVMMPQSSSNMVISEAPNTYYQTGTQTADTVLNTDCPTAGANDNELPLVMASLKICDVLKETSESLNLEDQNPARRLLRSQANSTAFGTPNSSPRRILRSQGKSTTLGTQNRRCNLKPAKIDSSDIEAYYLNKKYQKPFTRYLETIYEDPIIKANGTFCTMGPKKARKIRFTGITKPKDKKRKANLKKLIRNSVSKRASFTQEEFITHLCSLMLEDVCKMEGR